MGQHTDWVEDVLMAPKLQYLLVVLRRDISRQQLESIQPDYSALYAARQAGSSVWAICVTSGGEAERTHWQTHHQWEAAAWSCSCWADLQFESALHGYANGSFWHIKCC